MPTQQLTETKWVDRLARIINQSSVALSSAVVAPLASELPIEGRIRAEIPHPAPATDLALIEASTDVLASLIEVKRPLTGANWPSRASLRQLSLGDDELSRRIAARWLDDTIERLDSPHLDQDCIAADQGCEYWRPRNAGPTDPHFPVVPQADLYAATTSSVPVSAKLPPRGLRGVNYKVIGTSRRQIEQDFFVEAVSAPCWSFINIGAVIRAWSETVEHRDLSRTDATKLLRLIKITTRTFSALHRRDFDLGA